jgi:FkbM family methyltransferase
MRIKHWDHLSWARDRFGIARAICQYPKPGRGGLIKLNGVYIRDDPSDREVYDGVFGRREYAVDMPEPQLIVDAGAHIGLASVFFARRYPKATIVALEPDAQNFALLQRNTKGLSVKCYNVGLWSSDTCLRIVNDGAASWSFRVIEDFDGPIEAVTVDWIIRKHGRIDCLKMDIEGSEVAVFQHSRGWIGTIQTLIVELHDKEPGARACKDALKYAINGYRFKHSVSGENQVLVRY